MTKLIPNTFQCFNDHVDVAMELLTGDEYKVLNFATRHILGWQDSIIEERKRISLTMFEKGFLSKKYNRRFAGTGLSRKALVRILDFLTDCGLLVIAAKANEDGTLWELGDSPDWEKLLKRADDKQLTNQKRTAKARETSLTIRKSGVSDTPDASVSHTPHTTDTLSVGHTSTMDVGHTSGGDVGHTESNPIQNQSQNQLNTRSSPSLPVATASFVDALIFTPEMFPQKPNAIKEKAQAERSAKSPPSSSAALPPIDDDFNIVRMYRETWPKHGDPSPALKDILYAAAKKYPHEWIIDVFKEAAMRKAETWKYCETILENWATNGKTTKLTVVPKSTPADAPTPPQKPIPANLFRPISKASGGENGNA